MFIIETEDQSVNAINSSLVGEPLANRKAQGSSPSYQFDEMAKLRALFLGLIRQKRWIYFLNDQIKLRANHLPVLQVKLKEHHCQYQSLKKIIVAGNCSAVVVENNKLDNKQLEEILTLGVAHRVQLILLENIQDSETLH